MFFKNLFNVLKQKDLITQAIHDLDTMFDKSSLLYNESISSLAQKRKSYFDLYALDREINDLEKNIRKKILENLAIHPKQDVVASLILTSVIIDIERIGDYSKNISELNQLCSDVTPINVSSELMLDAGKISELFSELGKILHHPETHVALDIMRTLNEIKKELDNFICQIANSEQITVNEAVINVLFARYLKRVTAHLENVASSLVNSFDMIGFYQKET